MLVKLRIISRAIPERCDSSLLHNDCLVSFARILNRVPFIATINMLADGSVRIPDVLGFFPDSSTRIPDGFVLCQLDSHLTSFVSTERSLLVGTITI